MPLLVEELSLLVTMLYVAGLMIVATKLHMPVRETAHVIFLESANLLNMDYMYNSKQIAELEELKLCIASFCFA